jgi:hypothetical protein
MKMSLDDLVFNKLNHFISTTTTIITTTFTTTTTSFTTTSTTTTSDATPVRIIAKDIIAIIFYFLGSILFLMFLLCGLWYIKGVIQSYLSVFLY